MAFDSCWSSGGNIGREVCNSGEPRIGPTPDSPQPPPAGVYFCGGSQRVDQAVIGKPWSLQITMQFSELGAANTFRRGSSPSGFDPVWGGSTMGRNTMVRSLILTAALTMGLSTVASAASRRIQSAIRKACSHESRKDVGRDGGVDQAGVVIQWQEDVFARGDTALCILRP